MMRLTALRLLFAIAALRFCAGCASGPPRSDARPIGPPRMAEAESDAAHELRMVKERIVMRIRNDQFFWVLYPDGLYFGDVEPFRDTPAYIVLHDFSPADSVITNALVALLADTHRFAAAHLLLSMRLRPQGERNIRGATPVEGWFFPRKDCHWGNHVKLPCALVDYDGLRFTLGNWAPSERNTIEGMNKDVDFHAVTGEPDEDQQPMIRDLWRQRSLEPNRTTFPATTPDVDVKNMI
jgi:hypothetical protein